MKLRIALKIQSRAWRRNWRGSYTRVQQQRAEQTSLKHMLRNRNPEQLVYSAVVHTFNPPHSDGTKAVAVLDETYLDCLKHNKIGYIVTHSYGAPGYGHITYELTRITRMGVYGVVLEDSHGIHTPESVM